MYAVYVIFICGNLIFADLWKKTQNSQKLDGNENVLKNNRFNKENNIFALASRFFVHSLAVVSRLRRETALKL